jgi:ABC-type nitrate/sulfonate/bicarbonate transport system ATPase subunit
MKPYLHISDLRKSFPSRETQNVVVDGFNLEVARGEFVALIGHSGCGKSTVLSMVAGLSEPDSGAMILAGKELRGAGPDRGVVFQSPSLLPWRTAFENVMLTYLRKKAEGGQT